MCSERERPGWKTRISLPASSAGSVFCVSYQVLPETDRMRLKPRGGCKKNPRVKDHCFFSRHHDLTPGAGAECQEAKSTWVAKLGQGLRSPFCGGIVGLRNEEGGENTQRMQGKRKHGTVQEVKRRSALSLSWRMAVGTCAALPTGRETALVVAEAVEGKLCTA